MNTKRRSRVARSGKVKTDRVRLKETPDAEMRFTKDAPRKYDLHANPPTGSPEMAGRRRRSGRLRNLDARSLASVGIVFFLMESACAPGKFRPADEELMRAATTNDATRVEAALEQGADAGAHGDGGWTPLMLAARNGDSPIVELLLSRGADVNARNDHGQTALMVCTASIVRLLAEAGADVDARNTKDEIRARVDGETALMMTSDLDKTRALLEAGAEVNVRGASGSTALHYAASRGESVRVALLLNSLADVHANGGSALIAAAYQGDAQSVALLLQAGADVHVRASNGRTPLHFAATNRRRGVVDAVLAARPAVNSQSNDGSTALILAARDDVVDNVRALLAAGAAPEIRNLAGQTAMDWATARNNAEMVALLRTRGAEEPTATVAIDDIKRTARDERDARLEIFTTDVITDGRVAKIRGRIQNNYAQRVEGIRFEVALLVPGSLRVLDILRQEVDTTLDVGEEAPLRLDLESMYFGAEPSLDVQAFPVRLVGAQ